MLIRGPNHERRIAIINRSDGERLTIKVRLNDFVNLFRFCPGHIINIFFTILAFFVEKLDRILHAI